MWSTAFYFGNFLGPTVAGITVDLYGFRTTTVGFFALLCIILVVDFIELSVTVKSHKTQQKLGYEELEWSDIFVCINKVSLQNKHCIITFSYYLFTSTSRQLIIDLMINSMAQNIQNYLKLLCNVSQSLLFVTSRYVIRLQGGKNPIPPKGGLIFSRTRAGKPQFRDFYARGQLWKTRAARSLLPNQSFKKNIPIYLVFVQKWGQIFFGANRARILLHKVGRKWLYVVNSWPGWNLGRSWIYFIYPFTTDFAGRKWIYVVNSWPGLVLAGCEREFLFVQTVQTLSSKLCSIVQIKNKIIWFGSIMRKVLQYHPKKI